MQITRTVSSGNDAQEAKVSESAGQRVSPITVTRMQALSFAFFHHIFFRNLLEPCLKSDATDKRCACASVTTVTRGETIQFIVWECTTAAN